MANSYTTNLNLTKPEVGADTNAWGGHLNSDLDALDAIFKGDGTGTSVGLNVGSGKTLAVGGTLNVTGTATLPAGATAGGATVVTTSATQTLTNKTLTSPVISGGSIDGAPIGATTAANARVNNLTVLGTTTGFATVPSGLICMWSGASTAIPTGWYLCDGANGTPDLRDRFLVGAGSTYAVGATGGSKDAIVVAHTHTATSTVTDPGHDHAGVSVTRGGNGGSGTRFLAAGDNGIFSDYTPDVSPNTTGVTVSTTVASTGSSGTNANLPPYYALCFIMKA